MKTFAESRGLQKRNWGHRLDHWQHYGIGALARDSESWVTCACGNLCEAIPRGPTGYPEDNILFDLGCEFCKHLNSALSAENDSEGDPQVYINKAKDTLELIEQRSKQILTELGVI